MLKSRGFKVLLLWCFMSLSWPSPTAIGSSTCMELKQKIGLSFAVVGGGTLAIESIYALFGLVLCPPWTESGFEGCQPKEFWTFNGHPQIWYGVTAGALLSGAIGAAFIRLGHIQKQQKLGGITELLKRVNSETPAPLNHAEVYFVI